MQGLDFLDDIGMSNIKRHIAALARQLVDEVRSVTHRDGAPLVRVYGPEDHYDRGGTVAFNVLDRHGEAVPYAAVEEWARARRISVRGGCFCNPGASETAFEFVAERAALCLDETRRAGWSLADFASRMRGCEASHAVGAVRASFGVPSNTSDVERLIDAIVRGAECGMR